MGSTALAAALGGARRPPCSSKGIHAGGRGATGQVKVVIPVAIEVATEATEPVAEGRKKKPGDSGGDSVKDSPFKKCCD